MLTRIVKLSIRTEHQADFIAAFESKKSLIASFKGCGGVMLLQDINKPHLFFTYSNWTTEDALNEYRQSPLFASTWAEVKKLFSDKPEAWSVQQIA